MGWVCEIHPDKAWSDELGCMCGAGMPCDWAEGYEEPDTSHVIEEPQKAVEATRTAMLMVITTQPFTSRA